MFYLIRDLGSVCARDGHESCARSQGMGTRRGTTSQLWERTEVSSWRSLFVIDCPRLSSICHQVLHFQVLRLCPIFLIVIDLDCVGLLPLRTIVFKTLLIRVVETLWDIGPIFSFDLSVCRGGVVVSALASRSEDPWFDFELG